MKITTLFLGIIFPFFILSQTDQYNLEKYWKFRNTFREQFIKIGDQQGESLPANSLKPLDCINNIPYGDGFGEMHWGDGTIRHGHYLALLATEYRLLKNSGEDVTGVLNELYFALNAINRLDLKAEASQDEFYGVTLDQDLNGFFLREDVPEDFATNWIDDEMQMRCTNSAFYANNNTAKINDSGDGVIQLFYLIVNCHLSLVN